MARGRAYSVDFRLAMMRQHAQGRSFVALSRETGVPRAVLGRWWQRYEAAGDAGLQPRSRQPHSSPTRVSVATEARILRLRDRQLGPARIALAVRPSVSTVYRT